MIWLGFFTRRMREVHLLNSFKPDQKSYPLLPLRNMTVFPGTTISVEVGRQKSLREIGRAHV